MLYVQKHLRNYFRKNLIISGSLFLRAWSFSCKSGLLPSRPAPVQAKNAISVAVKNILGFLVSSIMYFLLGFGIMFGASYEGYLGYK